MGDLIKSSFTKLNFENLNFHPFLTLFGLKLYIYIYIYFFFSCKNNFFYYKTIETVNIQDGEHVFVQIILFF